MVTTAYVHCWGERVGAVAWDPTTGLARFEYDPAFLSKGWELSPLKMPLSTRIYQFPELRQQRNSPFDTYHGLPGLLADALPDTYGHQLIHAWLSAQGRSPDSMNPVELLCFLGTRAMGALEFEPVRYAENKNTFAVEVQDLVATAQKALAYKASLDTRLSDPEREAMREILKIGTSAGGARPKAVIAYNEKTGEVRSGQTKAPRGFEHWLIKLDGVSDVQLGATSGYGRVEMSYYQMATACGIDMMHSRLYEENGRAHFMTKRFDREGGETKHHIQSWCALAHFDYNDVHSYSYEQLFQTMRELRLTYPEAEQMYRRMVFNVLARNCDDHTKNFSFILKRGGRWALAPAYDLCHAYRADSTWVSQQSLSVNGKRRGITREDLLAVGTSMNIKRAHHIVDEVRDTVGRWGEFAGGNKVEEKLGGMIWKSMITNATKSQFFSMP